LLISQTCPWFLDCSLLVVLIHKGSKGKDMESEQDCVTCVKNLLFSKRTIVMWYGAKCKTLWVNVSCKCRTIMLKIRLHAAMQHHAQNTDVTLNVEMLVCMLKDRIVQTCSRLCSNSELGNRQQTISDQLC